MKVSAFRDALRHQPGDHLAFLFPDGSAVPAHAHVTEVGRTEKTFIDCGGRLRHTAACSLQVWVAEDHAHRLPAGKLENIMEQAENVIGGGDPEVQVECQRETLALYGISGVDRTGDSLVFRLETRHAACLAMDVCLPPADQAGEACCSTTGCC